MCGMRHAPNASTACIEEATAANRPVQFAPSPPLSMLSSPVPQCIALGCTCHVPICLHALPLSHGKMGKLQVRFHHAWRGLWKRSSQYATAIGWIGRQSDGSVPVGLLINQSPRDLTPGHPATAPGGWGSHRSHRSALGDVTPQGVGPHQDIVVSSEISISAVEFNHHLILTDPHS